MRRLVTVPGGASGTVTSTIVVSSAVITPLSPHHHQAGSARGGQGRKELAP